MDPRSLKSYRPPRQMILFDVTNTPLLPGQLKPELWGFAARSVNELSTPTKVRAIMPAPLRNLNSKTKALATAALVVLLVAFTWGYIPDQCRK